MAIVRLLIEKDACICDIFVPPLLQDVDPETVDTVLTLCAEEVCLAFLGDAERLHWPLQLQTQTIRRSAISTCFAAFERREMGSSAGWMSLQKIAVYKPAETETR
jgi:hypothetical protein